MKIAILLLVYNNARYIQYLHHLFDEIKNEDCPYDFHFFIYENNSSDQTKQAIESFMKDRNGSFVCEDIERAVFFEGGIQIQRASHMARLRQKLKEVHGKEAIRQSDFVFIIDSDVVFNLQTLHDMILSMTSLHDCVMLSGFSICYDFFEKSNKKNTHYYDSLAFISKDGISYKENDNTCLFDICPRCENHRRFKKVNIPQNKLLPSSSPPIEVNSAFGSMSVLRADIYNSIDYHLRPDHKYVCEHHAFSERIKNFGKIYVDPCIKLFTTIPSLRFFHQIEKDLKNIQQKSI